MIFTDTGKTVYDRTYSRTKPDGTKETWADTVERVVEGNCAFSPVPVSEQEKVDLKRMMLELKIIPAGRHLWATGVPGRQFNQNCWVSSWTENPWDHFSFTFMRLMEGGGVGTNYSNPRIPDYSLFGTHEVHIVCDPEHQDYQYMKDSGLLSDVYVGDWSGAFEVEDSREGWAAALVDLMQAYFRPAKNVNRVFDVSRVRPAGARLKQFGGRASGPGPLAKMLREVSSLLNECEYDDLDGMTAMAMDHAIAECVVSGGVRRSARMSIMHWDDQQIFEFLTCKTETDKHWSTNISVEVDDDFWTVVDQEDNEVLSAIAQGMHANGEPGIWNSTMSAAGEPTAPECTNPCHRGDVLLSTERGLSSYESLEKTGEDNLILQDARVTYEPTRDGKERPGNWKTDLSRTGSVANPASPVFLTQRDTSVVLLKTKGGFEVAVTPDHLMATTQGMVRADSCEGLDVLIAKGSLKNPTAGKSVSDMTLAECEMLLMGLITSDGTFSKGKLTEIAHVCLWKDDFDKQSEVELMLTRVYDEYKGVVKSPGKRPFTAFNRTEYKNKVSYTSSILAAVLKEKYGFSRETKHTVPPEVLASCREEGVWYLVGLFFGDGTVCHATKGRTEVRLNQSNFKLLQDVQRMLLTNGVFGRIYKRREAGYKSLPDGKGGRKEYWCKDNYDLIICGDRDSFRGIGFWDSHKDAKLSSVAQDSYVVKSVDTVVSVTQEPNADVYCLKEDARRTTSSNGFTTRRCGEITLVAWEPCVLGHVNLQAFITPTGDYDAHELYLAHGLMTRFLIRATYADVSDPKSAEIIKKNRRIGVGHLGVAGFLALQGLKYSEAMEHGSDFEWLLQDLYRTVKNEAVEYCHELRIPVPVKLTTVAPTGTIAKMPGVSEGIHPIFSKYFLRRIRFSEVDPDQMETVEQYRASGFKVEQCQYSPNTLVVEIPTKDSLLEQVAEIYGEERAEDIVQGADALSPSDMLGFQQRYQELWADNAVSYTVNFDPELYPVCVVEDLLWTYGPKLKGTTMFPDMSRPQSPYERLTKEQFEAFMNHTVGDGVDEACASGSCPIR